jgi:hypothetical protein
MRILVLWNVTCSVVDAYLTAKIHGATVNKTKSFIITATQTSHVFVLVQCLPQHLKNTEYDNNVPKLTVIFMPSSVFKAS